jgi:hypothetical protein
VLEIYHFYNRKKGKRTAQTEDRFEYISQRLWFSLTELVALSMGVDVNSP